MTDNEAAIAWKEAFSYDALGQFKKALEIRKTLEKAFPKNKLVLIALGDTYENLHRLDEAEKYYRDAVRLYPEEEAASKFLFHFLWDADGKLWEENRRDEAFEEMKQYGRRKICTKC